MESLRRVDLQTHIRQSEEYIDTVHRRMTSATTRSTASSMGSPTHIQEILDKYMHITPKSGDNDPEGLKKRKANSPLTMDNSVDIGNSEEYDLHTPNPDPKGHEGSIQTLITKLFDKSMKDIKDMISADRKDSNKLLQSVDKKVNDIEHKIDGIHSSLNNQSSTIEQLIGENKQLRTRIELTDGRLTRAEKVIDDVREELLQSNARSMKDNLIFQKVPENDTQTCKDTLFAFFRTELRISADDMRRIQILKCHRLGFKGAHIRASMRDIVAVVDDETKVIIWRHVKHLRGKKYSIFPQLPRELVTRKQQLMPVFKAARDRKANVKWLGEKLLLEKRVLEAPRDKICDIKGNLAEAITMDVKRSDVSTYNESSFQGSQVRIKSFDDITPALHAIYRDPNTARATHNMYAYRVSSGSGVRGHFCDDGEHGAGKRILALMEQEDIVDTIICVTRWYGGQHLGPARFNYILEAAKRTIDLAY